MTTYYIATSRHGDQRTYHRDEDCPALDRATGVTTREREAIPEDRTCPRCVDPDPEWNQGDGNDWSYQKALAREAGVDSEIVTDGGQEVVYVAGNGVGGNAIKLHTDPDCPQLASARTVLEKPADAYPGREVCSVCRGEVAYGSGGNSGPWQQLDAADPDDLVTDGGREPTIYAVEELPEDEKGGSCAMYTGVGPTRCGLPAEFVFVHEASLDPDDDRRRNCLCCADCKPVESVITDGGEDLPAPDRAEHERRARQAANSLLAWSRRAGLDPDLVLDEVRSGLLRTDGGEEAPHFCEICERGRPCSMTSEPLREIENGVCWIFEGADGAAKVRHEGAIEVYPNWVRLGGSGIPNWVPRERVEQVHER